jgi:hypothetical protein
MASRTSSSLTRTSKSTPRSWPDLPDADRSRQT